MKIFQYMNRHVDEVSDDLLRFDAVENNIDDLINYPKVKQLHIYGLKQNEFEYFVERYANNYDFIYFFKCPQINDLSKLSILTDIKYLSFFWNNKAVSLWDMTNNINLKGLFINDFSKLHRLDLLDTAKSLNEFHLSGGMWKNTKIETLIPIGKLRNLEYLSLNFVDIVDNDITPLFNLTNLKELRLSEETYEMEKYAALAARLINTECECFKGYIISKDSDLYDDGKTVRIVGKRKPRLNHIKSAEKFEMYIAEFENYKKMYKI